MNRWHLGKKSHFNRTISLPTPIKSKLGVKTRRQVPLNKATRFMQPTLPMPMSIVLKPLLDKPIW
jgi:hypothetical protein